MRPVLVGQNNYTRVGCSPNEAVAISNYCSLFIFQFIVLLYSANFESKFNFRIDF